MVKAKKELGQNWLTDNDSLTAIVQSANVAAGDSVLEVGPGTGLLTDKLVKTGATLTLLEFDRELIPRLTKQYADNPKVTVLEGDVRTFDLSQLPQDYKICANIPYYLTANLLRILTDSSHKPAAASLLVQKEVAEKIVNGNSMLPRLVGAVYAAELGSLVPARFFEPVPKVDSQVLILNRKDTPLVSGSDWSTYVRALKVGYANPRKKLRSNISAGLDVSKTEADALLEGLGISVDVRAEQLSQQDWLRLMHKL